MASSAGLVLLLLAGCAAVSAYYVPGTYPQEFLAGGQISGKATGAVWDGPSSPQQFIISAVVTNPPAGRAEHLGRGTAETSWHVG